MTQALPQASQGPFLSEGPLGKEEETLLMSSTAQQQGNASVGRRREAGFLRGAQARRLRLRAKHTVA